MTIAEIITIIIAGAGLVSALSLIYGKFITPVKKVVKQVEDNEKNIRQLEQKINEIKVEQKGDNAFSVEVRAMLLESLIAILDGLEQQGSNHIVTEQKQKLISFLTKQVSGK